MSGSAFGRAPAELWTSAQAAAADRATIEGLGVPSPVLMERAALCVTHELLARRAGEDVLVLVGPGNNGGDGLAVARHLHHLGVPVRAHLVTPKRTQATQMQHQLAAAYGVVLEEGVPTRVCAGTFIVDAMLGTGSRGAPRGPIAEALQWAAACHGPKLAVDLPTGVDADTGQVAPDTFVADCTVTFVRSKPGLHVTPGRDHAGAVVVADIGIRPEPSQAPGELVLIDPHAVAQTLAGLAVPQHKGERGHVGIVAGSTDTPGAAVLTAFAALRAGAGLITVAADDDALRTVLVAHLPEVMLARREGEPWLPRADALAVGPGLTDPADRAALPHLWARDPRPQLWDASALEALPCTSAPAGPRIVTPHPGEAARLLSRLQPEASWSAAEVQRRRLEAARALAGALQAVVVLKGAGTLVAEPSGRVAVAVVGGPELATAGSGDTLSGLGAALLARGIEAWTAAQLAVHLHGVAGTLAKTRYPVPHASAIAEQFGHAQASAIVRGELGTWPAFRRG